METFLTALSAVVFRDELGPRVAAGAAGVLAVVLAWHFVDMLRQGQWRRWTCWAAGILAAITLAWLVAVLAGGLPDNPWTRLVLLGLLSAATAGILYHSVFHYLGPARLSVLLLLRCLAIGALVLLLFKPALARRPGATDRPLLVILLDASQSMSEPDGPGGQPRFAAAVETVLAEQTRTETFFDTRYFVFGQSAAPVARAARLTERKPDGEATALDVALATAAPLLAEERAEGAILISDGIHNGTGSALAAADSLAKPVFAVGVGGAVPEGQAGRDVALARVMAPEQTFSHNVAGVDLDIHSAGFAGATATAVLRRVGGEELARTEVKLADGVVPARLEFVPKQVGLMELEVELLPLPGEAVAGNNRHQCATRVGQPQIKVLYVEGSIRSEYRFLTQELMADQHIELMTLIQIRRLGVGGAEGAQFQVRGTVGGKPLAGMPMTAEQFNLFDVFVIGDLDRTYLSDQQMALMQQAVKDGKGLLMIGGSHSFGPGGYGSTPIEQLLPVELGGRTTGQETMPFQLQLTVQGKVHPVFAGLVDFLSPPPNAPASQLPELTGCVKVLRAKAAGQVLAVHPSRQTPDGSAQLPVLTVQQYGAGRAAAFTADTTWRWKMFRTIAAYEGVYQRFWGQLIRWLASSEISDKAQQSAAIVNLPRSYFAPDEPIPVTARVWDKDGQPVQAARVEVRLAPAGQVQPQVIELAAVSDRPGAFQGQLPPQEPGTFQLAMSAHKAGVVLGTSQRQVEVGRPGAEAARRSANPELLRNISGRKVTHVVSPYVPLSQYDKLIEQLTGPYQQRQLAGQPESVWPSYTNTAYAAAMLAFFGLLSVEWLLRRRWQLQ